MRSFRRNTVFSLTRRIEWFAPVMVLSGVLLVWLDAPGGDDVVHLAQSQSTLVEGIGGSGGPNPEVCAQCFEQLKKDNRDCQALSGEDWKVCREAAATAYRRCSKGC